MEFVDTIRRRRMVRSFTADPVEPSVIDDLCDLARRAPSAGNSQGTAFLVLDQPATIARYWDLTLPEARRVTFGWPGLLQAPVLIVVAVRPATYVDRYREPDKAATGLGGDPSAWPVPYWWVDAGAAAEHLLLGAVDAGLGACLFGAFEYEAAVAEAFAVPDGWRLAATVALGHRVPEPEGAGRSAGRPRRPIEAVVHRNRW